MIGCDRAKMNSVRTELTRNHRSRSARASRHEPWTRPMIEAQGRRIICDVTGAGDFPLSASFVEDIDID